MILVLEIIFIKWCSWSHFRLLHHNLTFNIKTRCKNKWNFYDKTIYETSKEYFFISLFGILRHKRAVSGLKNCVQCHNSKFPIVAQLSWKLFIWHQDYDCRKCKKARVNLPFNHVSFFILFIVQNRFGNGLIKVSIYLALLFVISFCQMIPSVSNKTWYNSKSILYFQNTVKLANSELG